MAIEIKPKGPNVEDMPLDASVNAAMVMPRSANPMPVSNITGGSPTPDGTTSAPTASLTNAIQSSMITDPTALATSIASAGWNDWQNNLSPYLQATTTDAQNAASRIAGNASVAAQGDQRTQAGLVGDYDSIYRGAGQKYGNLVNTIGSEAYKDQQRGKAVADVQQNIDTQLGSAKRDMMRMGVNPSSGRMAAMQNANSIAGAAAKANAASQSDARVLQQYAGGLKDMNSMGLDALKASDAMNSAARGWSSLGLDATKNGFGFGATYGDLASNSVSRAGNVAARAAETQNQATTTAANLQAAKDANSIPNLLLSGVVKAGTTALNGAVTSGVQGAIDWAKNKYGSSNIGDLINYTGTNSPAMGSEEFDNRMNEMGVGDAPVAAGGAGSPSPNEPENAGTGGGLDLGPGGDPNIYPVDEFIDYGEYV